jgi:phosphotransferase system enzyme I (PtsI)
MVLNGNSAAPGIAVGNIFVYKKNFFLPVENYVSKGEEQAQLDRYNSIKKQALEQLEEIKLSMQKHDPKKAEIFRAHQEIIDDIVINEEIPSKILNDRMSGDWAIYHVYETVLALLKQTPDPLIAERASDFHDVRTLLLRLWYGEACGGLSSLSEPVIVAAHELQPSDTASMDKNKVLAILTESGGVTSHAAIIAKSFGIPTLLGIHALLENVSQGQFALVDADEGKVIIEPEEEEVAEYEKKYDAFRRDKQAVQSFLAAEGRTKCGVKIDIGINIAGVTEEELSASEYTDFVGLFRTEFLYMGKDKLPLEEEQVSSYKKVLESFGEKEVILRTIDIGGDKPLSCMEMPPEDNPFLGNRALRFCFANPEIFKTQIRAALRSSVSGNLWLMLPMVTSVDDIKNAKEIIVGVSEDLIKEGESIGEIKTGIMVEVPSIALVADHAAREADFACIGTNDLCQYVCAADRHNSAVEPYYQSYHPAIFKLIRETVSAFWKEGKSVSICGELASDPAAVPVLIGLGLRKLSMGAASVPAIKRLVSSLTVAKCEEIAAKVLNCATAADVKQILTIH